MLLSHLTLELGKNDKTISRTQTLNHKSHYTKMGVTLWKFDADKTLEITEK